MLQGEGNLEPQEEKKKFLSHQVLRTIFYTEQEQHMSVQQKHSRHAFERVLPLHHYMIEFAGIFPARYITSPSNNF
jgi:hypothetical protein